MNYKEQLFKKLKKFLDESVIEYSPIAFEEATFYPDSFMDFITNKVDKFSSFSMKDSKNTLKVKRYLYTLFRRKYPNKSLYLILFLHGSPYEQKIIHLHSAYDFYTLFNKMLISDWAVTDDSFQLVITADDITQNFSFSQDAHSEALIYVDVHHKFPPHQTLN